MTTLFPTTNSTRYALQIHNGTVCTPYDSRMIDKKAELLGRIVSRTKRQMKARLATYS